MAGKMDDMLGKQQKQHKDDRYYSANPIPYTGKHYKHSISFPSKAPVGMPKSVPLVFILFLGIAAWSQGLSTRVMTIFLIASALMLMAYYFESRPRDQPPSRTERICAFVWRGFRTVIGLLGAFVLIGTAITMAVAGMQSLEPYQDALLPGVLILMGLGCIWWGLIGHAWGGMPRDDLELHRENKRRYNWRF